MLKEADIEERPSRSVFLNIGELCASRQPLVMKTVLGACAAVCLYDASTAVAGMNHFIFPSGAPDDFRNGEASIRALIKRMAVLGAQQERIKAMIFGGADMSCSIDGGNSYGSENILLARRVLRENSIRIITVDHGGCSGRRVDFNSSTGEALVSMVPGGLDAASHARPLRRFYQCIRCG